MENELITPAQIMAYLSGACAPEEVALIEQWVAASDQHKRLFDEYRQLFVLSGISKEMLEAEKEMDGLSGDVRQRMNARPAAGRWRAFFRLINKAAAVICWPLLITVAVLFFRAGKNNDKSDTERIIKTATGVVTQFRLPDSTTVWLNGGSTLRYSAAFNGRLRDVALDGEAYFEVAASPDRPFIVRTPADIQVKVLGTRFNVSAYGTDREADVTLITGAVRIEAAGNTKGNVLMPLILHPGERASYDRQQLKVQAVNDERDIAWTQGRLVLKDMPMEQAVKKLSRKYNVDIVLKDERLKEYSYTATFSDESITQILDLFKLTSPIKYEVVRPSRQSDSSFTSKKIIISMIK